LAHAFPKVKRDNTNISIRNQTAYGSKRIKPLVIDKSVLFVDGSGDKIREFNYTFADDLLPFLVTLRNKISLDLLPGITQIDSILPPILCLCHAYLTIYTMTYKV
jgi:hypothetical protein